MVDKKSTANLITGVFYQVINTLMGLVLPYLFITSFGSETNGLLSSVTQLFVYVELLEAGVGAAAVQAMYQPIANRDREGINGVLAAANRSYLRTGALYVLCVAGLALVYPLFIHSGLSQGTIAAVVFFQGCGGAVSYLASGKYVLLLKAEGKLYVNNSLNLIASILRNAGKIAAIALGYGVVTVQIVHFSITVARALAVVIYVKWKYKWVHPWGKPNFQAISQHGSALVHQLTWLVFNHTDVMILTFVTGKLALVSVYSLYLLVFEAIQNMLDIIGNGLQYKLGYSAQVSLGAFRKYYRRYEAGFLSVSFALILVAYLLVQPFIRLYTAGVNDVDYLPPGLPELFAAMKLLSIVRQLNRQAADAAGHFRRTRKYSVIEMIINLGLSLLLAPFWGIYGVLVGSIAALLYSLLTYTRYTNKEILETNCRRSSVLLILYLLLAVIMGTAGKLLLPAECTGYPQLILLACPVTAAVGCAYAVLWYYITRYRGSSIPDNTEIL